MQGSFSGFVANGGDLSATGDFIPKEGMQNRWEVGREKRGNVHVASTRCGLFTTEPPLDGGVKGKAKGASELTRRKMKKKRTTLPRSQSNPLSENRVKRKKRLVFGGVVMGLSWER
ncbi:hypothetical protein B296_00045673 [Ensete ventricosum]|uniref:Uncharacterized protein n=1 Tax=Ensete ventricosum TaxID=4639 RepID=A0A426YUC5_ENSVE|nr:hypothetical protein B296_00045673 [Ensete ventricosum]